MQFSLTLALRSVVVLMAASGCGTSHQGALPEDLNVNHLNDICRRSSEIAKARLADVYAIPAAERTYDNTIRAFVNIHAEHEKNCEEWQLVAENHPDPAVREAAYSSEFGLYVPLNETYSEICRSAKELGRRPGLSFSAVERLALDDLLGDCVLDFGAAPRPEVNALQSQIRDLSTRFTSLERAIHLSVTRAQLASCPKDVIETLGIAEGAEPVVLTGRSEAAVLVKECTDPQLRQAALQVDFSAGFPESYELLGKMLELRQQLAGLEGHSSYAGYRASKSIFQDEASLRRFVDSSRDIALKAFDVDFKAIRELQEKDPAGRSLAECGNMQCFSDFRHYMFRHTKVSRDPALLVGHLGARETLQRILTVIGGWAGLEFSSVEPQTAECRMLSSWAPETTFTFRATTAGFQETLGEVCYFFHDSVQNGQTRFSGTRRVDEAGRTTKAVSGRVLMATPLVADPATGVLSFRPEDGIHDIRVVVHETGHVLDGLLLKSPHGLWTQANKPSALTETQATIFEALMEEPDFLERILRHSETGEPLPPEVRASLIAEMALARKTMDLRVAMDAAVDWTLHGGYGPIGTSVAEIDRALTDMFRERFGMNVDSTALHWPSTLLHLGWIPGEYWSYQIAGRVAEATLKRARAESHSREVWADIIQRYIGVGGDTGVQRLVGRLREDFAGDIF